MNRIDLIMKLLTVEIYGLTVKLCPGSGATCKIVISTSAGTYTYNGSKTKGGPDVVFK
jgi:hypothetical protein